MKLRTTLLLLGTMYLGSSLFANTLDHLFSASLLDAKSEQTDAAIENLNKWLSEGHRNATNSPEVHHNLAALYARKSDYVNTSKELADAAALYTSPIARLRELQTLLKVQRNLGIQHSTLEKNHLFALLLVSNESVTILAISSLWFFFFYFYFHLSKRCTYKFLSLIGVMGLLLTSSLWGFQTLFGSIGILTGSQEVSVYSSPEMKEKIISFPPGTIVRVKKTLRANHQILEPVFGWIKSSDCLLTALPASVGS